MSDLEGVAKTDGFASLPAVLLNRIAREAGITFDAPKGAVTFEVIKSETSNGVSHLMAVLHFDAIKLSWGAPGIGVEIEQQDDRFHVRIGARENTPTLSYMFDFGWTDETPAALFPALFACALESMRARKDLK